MFGWQYSTARPNPPPRSYTQVTSDWQLVVKSFVYAQCLGKMSSNPGGSRRNGTTKIRLTSEFNDLFCKLLIISEQCEGEICRENNSGSVYVCMCA